MANLTALPRGTLLVSLSLGGTWARTGHPEYCPEINPIECAGRDVPPEWHDIALYFGEARLRATLGLTDWLAAEVSGSLRVVAVRFQLQDLATREPIDAPFGEEIHHRTETILGPTDPWLSLRATKRLGPWSFVFRAGATVPVGSTVENPFALARRGRSHQHLQLGTGTVDPLAEVEVRRAIGRFTLAGSLLAKGSIYANSQGYQAGDQLTGSLRLASDLWTRRLSFLAGVVLYREGPERWAGLQESEGNLGRTDLLADLSVAFKLPKSFTISANARIPIWSAARGEQLYTPAIFELSLTRPFALF